MIQIKNQYVNDDKIITLQFATSEKTNKCWLVVNLDTQIKETNKLFIEIAGESEYLSIVEQIKKQLNK